MRCIDFIKEVIFYRAMHFNRLSVRPSVTLVDCDHIGWNFSKIISPLVSMGRSLSADPNIKGTPGNLGPKWPTPCWFERRRHSIANYGRMVTDSASVESIKETTIALSNGAIADPLQPSLPQNGGSTCPPSHDTRMAISTGDPIHFMFDSDLPTELQAVLGKDRPCHLDRWW